MRFECGLWKRWFRDPIPPRETGRLYAAAAIGAAHLAPPEKWDDLIPEGKEIRWKSRVIPEVPGRRLYDGTKVKHQKAFRLKVPELIDAGSRDLPPTGRRYPRGATGWKLAFFLGATFFGAAVGMPFAGDFYGGDQSTSLINLPFVDLTNPSYNINQTGTDTYTTLQALFTTIGAGTYYAGYNSIITSSKPILISPGTWVIGAGVNRRQTTSGTTFRVASGAVAADWAGQGYFTSAGFANNTQLTGLGEICGFRDFLIDGNAQTYGNGITLASIAQPFFINLRWENYKGTQGMPQRGAGNAKNFGQGFMVMLTTYCINGTTDASTANNPNDPTFWNIRQTAHSAGSNGTACIWTDDGANNGAGNSTITDGILYVVQPEGAGAATSISNQAAIAQGVVDINHAGGWHLDFYHQNGPGGQGLVLRNCMSTHVVNCWLDGWGTSAGNGNTWDCIQATTTTGGGAGIGPLNIWGNTFRYRDEQVNSGGTVTYRALNYTCSGNNGMLNFTGNEGFIQSNLATGTQNIFNLALAGGTLSAVIGNNNFWTDAAVPFADANIFQSTVSAAGFAIRNSNNNWDYVATLVPTTGQWPKGYTRWSSAPALNSGGHAICTTGGNPGTWATVNIVTQTVASFGTTTNTQNPAAAIPVTGASFAIGASEEWTCTFDIDATSTGTGGQQYSVTLPAGATCRLHVSGPNTAASNYRQGSTGGTSPFTVSGTVAIANFWVSIVVHVTNSTTAGTVQLNIANVTNSESQSVNSGTLVATRIA